MGRIEVELGKSVCATKSEARKTTAVEYTEKVH